MLELPEENTTNSLQEAMTPMIDVIFVLIAFMMLIINAPLLTMKVDLPKVVDAPKTTTVNKQVVTITLQTKSDVWFINEEPVTSINELKTRLEQQKQTHHGQLSVVLHSDKNVTVERIVELFSLLQTLKLNVTHLALDHQAVRT